MEKRRYQEETLTALLGRKINLVHFDFFSRTLLVSFEGQSVLRFLDCAFVYDYGLTGKELRFLKLEMGEFGMVIGFWLHGISSEEYDDCVLSHAEDMEQADSTLSIAFKDLSFEGGECRRIWGCCEAFNGIPPQGK